MANCLKRFFSTDGWSYTTMIVRITLGAVMLPHGMQKLMGWFWGNGFSATMNYFTLDAGFPWIVALLVILGESLGALALIVGFASRFMAFGIFTIMTGAMFIAHWKFGFFIDWFGAQWGQGIEFHLLMIGMSLSLMISWGWAYSFDMILDKMVNKKKEKKKSKKK